MKNTERDWKFLEEAAGGGGGRWNRVVVFNIIKNLSMEWQGFQGSWD